MRQPDVMQPPAPRGSVAGRILLHVACLLIAVCCLAAYEHFRVEGSSDASVASLVAAAVFGFVPARDVLRVVFRIEGKARHLVHALGGLALVALPLTGVVSGTPVLAHAAMAPFAIMGAAQAVMHQNHPRNAEQPRPGRGGSRAGQAGGEPGHCRRGPRAAQAGRGGARHDCRCQKSLGETMPPLRSVLFLVFPNVGEQDLLIPRELFRAVAWDMGQRGEKLDEGTVHPSTIALVWHLFGDAAGRALAAGWDTLPLFGEALFSLVGPVMNDDERVKAGLQDAWENVFLPA